MNCTDNCPIVPHFHLFGIPEVAITYYATIILCGMIAAFVIIALLFKRRNISIDLALTYFCVGLPVALVTTRLFYCITGGVPIQEWFSFESISRGGLSIIGGIIGGTAAVAGVSALKKVNFLRVGDCIVVGLVFAQAVGRWGNFVNGEVYGLEVLDPALQWFPMAVQIGEKWHYAFFFYESAFNMCLAAALFVNGWLNDKKPNGINTALYFIGYGLIRTIMEPLRMKDFILSAGDVPWSLVFSIVLLVGGLALLTYLLINNKKKEGKLFGSATGEASGIVQYIKDGKDDEAYFSKINMMCKKHPENYKEKPKKEKKQ
ncbi:MAG: prolipoprotein diacylglyceryl transferase [Clostridia bacterium]|nr:prolipoprotein diacylglyceryl transferase [Clostridia bacterium]